MAKFLTNLDLSTNQIQNVVVHKLTSAPTGVAGQIYYDNEDELIYLKNDSDWVPLSTGSSGGDITSVVAGDGLQGGGTSGDVTLNIDVSDFVGTGLAANGENIDIAAEQTLITSIYATDLIIGEDSQTAIDFGSANEIDFKVDNANRLTLTAAALYPATNNQIDLGTASLEFKDAYFDGTVTSDAFAGPLTGNVTGDASGSAGTVTSIGNLTGDVTSSNRATTIAAAAVHHGMLNDDIISGQGAVAALAQDDLLVVHDTSAGTVNKITYSNFEDDIFGNVSGDGTIAAGGALTVTQSAGDFTVTGDLIVSGDTTTVNTANLLVEDPLIGLASGNGANSVDIGIWGKYTATGAKYTGLFRDASDSDEWKLFATTGNSHETPGTTTTINTGTGFTYANLTVGTLTADDDIVGNLTGNADTAGSCLVATRVTITDNESTNEENQITFIEGAAGSGDRGLEADGNFTYNPSTNTVSAPGALFGNISIGGQAIIAQATTNANGGVELATAAEVLTGTDAARVVTADTLAAKSVIGVIDVSSLTDDHIVTITHNLGTADVIVEMYDIVTDQTVYADVYRTTDDLSTASTSVISIQFGATAPTNDINCLITSVKGATAAPTVAYT